ncbi:MAG TPA: MBL fold metallo-hydrolase [Firmicutes bacterium]|nr:MBL fold metallo-hydrolase [Bacillota bacterium]
MGRAKRIVSFILISIICCGLCSCQNAAEAPEQVVAPEAGGDFYITVLDIGKADAIILRTSDKTALIDCGEDGDGEDVVEYLFKLGIDRLDYLIITHFDKDHVGGAKDVISSLGVDRIFTPDYTGNNDEYEEFIAAAEQAGVEPEKLSGNISFTLGDVSMEIYPPLKSYYAEGDNDYSLVISATHGENSFLFAGDAEKERLSELSLQTELKHDFLKVPHHGRVNDETENFLNSVSPEYAVITCSKKNPPDDEILNILNALGCSVYLTEDGDVQIKSDGKTIMADYV